MQLSLRTRDNTLRLTLADDVPAGDRIRPVQGLVDIADSGRLIGLEIQRESFPDVMDRFSPWLDDDIAADYIDISDDSVYVRLSDADDDDIPDLTREATVELSVEFNNHDEMIAIAIPRRGHGYEISYPSGNR